MKIRINKKDYKIIDKPQRHILISTKKELHGWWPGKRECTSERMLINPYNGCGIGCFFCYSLAFPGYFQIFREKGVITVAKDFDKSIAKQLDSINVASCGYLSPVTDLGTKSFGPKVYTYNFHFFPSNPVFCFLCFLCFLCFSLVFPLIL